MKKFKIIAILSAFLILLVGCGKKEEAVKEPAAPVENGQEAPATELVDLKVAASPSPHAEILEVVKEDLAAEGVNLIIQEFTDYVLPNLATASGEVDANYFQHGPYLENFSEENNLDLVSFGTVHVEPIAAYSNKLKSIDELPEGGKVIIPNDPTNGGRALLLLDNNGIIKLKDNTNVLATEQDIEENPKNLEFLTGEAAQLPALLQDVDLAVINGNYAIGAGLNPLKDSLLIEGEESFYTNILVTTPEKVEDESIQKLLKAVQSDKVKDFIIEKYDGAVIPAF